MTQLPSKPIYLPPIEQGKSDYRSYRPLILSSSGIGTEGLTVLLANDPQSKHFAASVSVHAGASADPRKLPGLAHFCEHMCFLGSSAYPHENEYKQYLAQHGGKSNASTSMSHTTYQFDVLADFGEKALDIFSHFFRSPLFTQSGTAREVQAVDSENSKNLVNDGRRRWQVLKSLGDQEHHFTKFSTGNKDTLPACESGRDNLSLSGKDSTSSFGNQSSTDVSVEMNSAHPLQEILNMVDSNCDEKDMATFVRVALLAFHKRHYRPNNMTLVVAGPQSLDTLESWVVPRFSTIPDRWMSEKDDMESVQLVPEKDVGDHTQNMIALNKWNKMHQVATQLIDEGANKSPPVSVLSASTVKDYSAFRPELHGGKWPVVITTKPLQSLRKLALYFPMPPTWDNPDRSPMNLLSHCLGHEGRGSAFALLQDSGWVSSLSTGSKICAPDQTLFQIQMNLTAEGETHWKDVVNVIFDYGKMLCNAADETSKSGGGKHDPLCRIWDEVGALDRMHFHQTSPGEVYSFVSAVAESISKYGTTTCLSAGSMLNETMNTLPAENFLSFCQRIIPDNCFIERCSESAWKEMESFYEKNGDKSVKESNKEFSFGKKREKWYGIDYYLSPILDEDVKQWIGDTKNISLHLPDSNVYIPRSLELCPELPDEAKNQRIDKPIDPPRLIVNDPSVGRLWWRLDDRYALPKASLTLLIRTPIAEYKLLDESSAHWNYDTNASMRSNFLTGIFSDAMAQDTYAAHLAGLNWSLSKSSLGFTLSCHGYSDRLSDLGLKLLTSFSNVEGYTDHSDTFITESYFRSNKDKVIRGLKSYFESKRADSLALYYRNLLMNYRSDGIEMSLEQAKAMKLNDVMEHLESIWKEKSLELECLYTGNVSEKDAKSFFNKAVKIIERAQTKVSLPTDVASGNISGWLPGPLERRLPTGNTELHFQSKNEKEENGAVIVTYQSGRPAFKGKSLSSEKSLHRTAAIRLLSKMIREPFFDELRTKQQLGYIVGSYYDVNYTYRHISALDTSSGAASSLPVPFTTVIDSIVLYVLSRKEEPSEVANRIDDFLLNFRSRLEEMPASEIEDYAESLANSLIKPIRKLSEEASHHFSKICRFAPEVLYCDSQYTVIDLPWNNQEIMADAVRRIDRNALLEIFDNFIKKNESGGRISSFVYGKTFPKPPQPALYSPTKHYISSTDD